MHTDLLEPPLLFQQSEVAQSCPILCDPMDCSLPSSSVHTIFQARVLEWVAISSPGDLPDPGIELGSAALSADALPSETPGKSHIPLYSGSKMQVFSSFHHFPFLLFLIPHILNGFPSPVTLPRYHY